MQSSTKQRELNESVKRPRMERLQLRGFKRQLFATVVNVRDSPAKRQHCGNTDSGISGMNSSYPEGKGTVPKPSKSNFPTFDVENIDSKATRSKLANCSPHYKKLK
jgi:hypothetical protein